MGEGERGGPPVDVIEKSKLKDVEALSKGGDVGVARESKRGRTAESAVEELRAIHAKWKALPEGEREEFTSTWLDDNAARLVSWLREHGGIQSFVALAGGEVKNDFVIKRISKRTPASALEELRTAHDIWKALPEKERGSFSPTWLQKKTHGLSLWFLRHGGIDSFIALAGGEVEQDFQRDKVLGRTPESVVEELRAAHTRWKALPKAERGNFGPGLLYKKYSGLNYWMERNGGVDFFISLAGGEVEQDYKVLVNRNRTPESAVEELQAAHTRWKALPEKERGSFSPTWLKEKARGLSLWFFRHGGIDSFIALAGGEVMSDFNRDRRVSEVENTQQGILRIFVSEVAEGQTQDAQDFKAMIRAVGPSRYLDILYKFRPDFRGLPVDQVRGIIADYLGDYLAVKNDFRLPDVEMVAQHLSDLSFQEGLYEAVKDNGLRFYFEQRRAGVKESGRVIEAYLDHLIEAFSSLHNKELDDVLQRAVIYYDSVFKDFHKPTQFVDTLTVGRDFPDINQRINMKELAEKKRLLIADEMGLGKSASVIMAKEQLGVRCALVIAPSNVIPTWEKYLSDDHERGGYYNMGRAPKVLSIQEPNDLEKLSAETYDFILISQEKMNDRYVGALQVVDYDMMVVDEVHKLKTIEGTRAPQLIQLSSKIEGDNKYLAMLSGTPVPNKIEDIAVILKMLYPDKFAAVDDRELVKQIIHGEVVDLRSLLLPRMQLKDLKEGVEMPPLEESLVAVDMTEIEREVYEVILEDDEMTPTEKMKVLRQFLLNPKLIDSTPGIESAKVVKTSEVLEEAFRSKDKVVLFVNDYVEGVMRGDGAILDELGLPGDIKVRVIHGKTARVERDAIQNEFNQNDSKILLVVSGQTADVGVDFSGANQVIFYNEPWTEYQRRQELGRAYRPGLKHPLLTETLITSGTIEEGMHEYIRRKYLAVEKLLRGIPITDLERELLAKDEKSEGPDLSVNPELAEYYFSSWDKMMKMFAYAREIGEKDFKKFLAEYGRDYAESYQDLGNRSYQANANRVSGTVIHEIAHKVGANPHQLAILDLASGPEMLRQHIGEEYREQIISIDINKEHFVGHNQGKIMVGSILEMPFSEKAFDYVNMCLSLHYTNFIPSKGKLERLQV
jgi:superfamily II DNA/RNA helicase